MGQRSDRPGRWVGMDEALDLADYLPIAFKTSIEEEYISFLWEVFETNYQNGIYHFAFLAYHLLMMSIVYFNVWQIREINSEVFEESLGDASQEYRNILLDSLSPFSFSQINEKHIFQLFRPLGLDDTQIRVFGALVDDRNDAAHANGNIYFQTQPEIDAKIRQILEAVEEIQSHSQPIIDRCYVNFLLQSPNPDEREYPGAEDQIREVLIHGNYLSRKDIEFCLNFNTLALGRDNRKEIEALHNSLCESYSSV